MKAFTATCMLFLGCVATLTTLTALQAAEKASTPRWHLYGAIIDAATGEIRAQAPIIDPQTRKPAVFEDAETCVAAALDVGPIEAHDGVAIVIRCVREDAIPVPAGEKVV